ncbi:MAG: hypothetical protein Aurels2KO_30720 [Aureliella sp.]
MRVAKYDKPISDSNRWMVYVTDWVCNGCTVQIAAMARATSRAWSRSAIVNGELAGSLTNVRRVILKRQSPASK